MLKASQTPSCGYVSRRPALWLPTVSPIDFLDYSLSLWEFLKVVFWSKALGMSSAFYLVAVMENLAVVLVGRRRAGP
jgi:hypothetical protein